MASALSDVYANWLTALQHPGWLLLALFAVALAESLLVVGLLIPGVAILVALTLLAVEQSLSPWLWWLAGASGALCGDGLSFHIGRCAGPGLARWRIFSRHPHWLPAGHDFFARYGLWSIALGRFVGLLRPLVPAVAGVCDMKPQTFWVVNIWSSAAWAAFYLLPVYWFGQALLTLVQPWQLMLGLGLVTLLALLVSRLLRR
ncbi:MAG: DedA family protein [Saccharospirillaceae bacterium]|nr:DedA family protein [Saccharospirillaceae bacterium]MCD8530508.1 DedA family protein [Saccharospirillaceae bacterium]